MKASRLLSVVVVCVLTVLVSKPAHAIPAIDFLDVSTNFSNGTWSLGFEFTTNQDINVTSLGFYDDLGNGFLQSHDVGIFDVNTEALLASTTVSSSDALDGFFRYNSLSSSLSLNANNTYRIAGVTGNDNYTWNPTGFSVDPAINFEDSYYIASNSLTYPTYTDGINGYFGPNFQFDIAAQQGEGGVVPEPMTLGLFGTGIAGLLGLRRRKES